MRRTTSPRRPQREALLWETKLRRTSITTDELRAFREWLDSDVNALAWDQLSAERYVHDRYVVRRDAEGFTVVDVDRAPPVVEGEGTLEGLSGLAAKQAAERLNHRDRDQLGAEFEQRPALGNSTPRPH